jgi:hypothetical protein
MRARRRSRPTCFYQRALAIAEKSLPANHPTLAAVRRNYTALLDRLGCADEAAALRVQAPR